MGVRRKLMLLCFLITAAWLNQHRLNAEEYCSEFPNAVQCYDWQHELPDDCGEQQQLCESYCVGYLMGFFCQDHGDDSSGVCECHQAPECGTQWDYCDTWNSCCPGYECDYEYHECVWWL